MDDHTYQYMRERMDKYDSLSGELAALKGKRYLAAQPDTAVCAHGLACNYCPGLPFPDEARKAVIACIDEMIAKVERERDAIQVGNNAESAS